MRKFKYEMMMPAAEPYANVEEKQGQYRPLGVPITGAIKIPKHFFPNK